MICNQCPRRCGALRTELSGEGFCQMPSVPVAARAALHHWEEPCLSGTGGAGTVFFSGCTLNCVFCQNEEISHKYYGKPLSPDRLREIFMELAAQGAHNIDLVNPTHFSHVLLQALSQPLPVPVVWNSGGYDSVDTLRQFEGKVDIYLPDLKYLSSERAAKYSGAADYPEIATAAIREMYHQVGPPVMENGLIKRGVIIRHLLLPGQLREPVPGRVKEDPVLHPPEHVVIRGYDPLVDRPAVIVELIPAMPCHIQSPAAKRRV